MKNNKPYDLFWIIPEIMGEFILTIFIPIMLIKELSKVGFFSINGMIYISISYLLIRSMNLMGLRELSRIKWNKNNEMSKM